MRQSIPNDTAGDGALVHRARQGDQSALAQLVERHFDVVHAIAYARLGNREAAEDLAQEVLLRAWLRLDDLREPDRFGAWVARMTRNLAVSWVRSGGRSSRLVRMVPMDESIEATRADGRPNAAESAAEREQKALLEGALAKLTPRERELVLMHYGRSMSQREIASSMGVHHTTIGRRLEAALGRLKRLLGREVAAPPLPRPQAKAHAVALLTAAGGMSTAAKASLAATAKATAPSGIATNAALISELLQTIATHVAFGVQTMAIGSKVAAGVVVVAVGGAIWFTQSSKPAGSPGTSPSGAAVSAAPASGATVDIPFGVESAFTLPLGETRRLNIDSGGLLPTNTMDVTAKADGSLDVVHYLPDGTTRSENIPATRPGQKNPATTIKVWGERGMCGVFSAAVRPGNGGTEVSIFSANKPEALPAVRQIQKDRMAGKITTEQYHQALANCFQTNGLLPKDASNRALVLDLLALEFR